MKYFVNLIVMLFITLTSTISYAENSPKILLVLTSHSELGDTGKKTGFWLPELTHPYYEFKKAGYLIDVASIQGGIAPVDPKSLEEPDYANQRFLQDAELMAKVFATLPLSKIDPSKYQAVVFAGGSGPMWDFPNNEHVNRVAAAIYDRSRHCRRISRTVAWCQNLSNWKSNFLRKFWHRTPPSLRAPCRVCPAP